MHPSQWREALDEIEAMAQMSGDSSSELEAKRLANVVRDDVEAMEKVIEMSAKRGSDAVKVLGESGNSKKRASEVLAWRRGSSLSFRFEDYDTQQFEELHERARAERLTLRVRPAKPGELAANAAAFAKGDGVRAAVHALEQWPSDDIEPGDWIAVSCAPRNFGGHSGRANVATFGTHSFVQVHEPEPEDALPP